MRIVVIGQAEFGQAVLQGLLDRGEEVAAVFYERDEDPLQQLAAQRGAPTHRTRELRNPTFSQGTYDALAPDLNVMAFVNVIIPTQVLERPTHGTIQYHPSLLPLHRGRSAINWAIINGDTKTGLTIFWPDEGVDTGPILLQREVDIAPTDTLGGLYFNKLFPLGVEAMVEAVGLVRQGKAPKIPQDHLQATYEPPCEGKVARIQWFHPAQRVYDLIRGCDPRPGAFTIYQKQELQLFDAELHPRSAPGMPGQVLTVDDQGFTVALNGGEVRIGRVRPAGGAKVSAAEFARLAGLKAGDRMGR